MFKKIVAAIDGSEASKHALLHAIEIGKRFDAKVTVITVASFSTEPTFMEQPEIGFDIPHSSLDGRAAMDALEAAEERHHIELLKDAEEIARANDYKVKTELLRGSPSDEIIDFLHEHKHDLVVMGSRGMGTVKRLLLGSTSSAVVQHCKHSVLIVK